ncbi:cysteine proteinase [Laetiporus sulphureus 93-53]|uniref:Ubiquitin carboxyl-terminal hydrolase n=1 Tax=Laetiporus sulphureus 93-53 TaxID=1314785 RepID=A0A165B548_9APHY|nr:cysteine proteinase [Laetiporus sulphureus 93-53]KZT00260.1 cysteine proteinase [Laetiporus sulphureus 93-53]
MAPLAVKIKHAGKAYDVQLDPDQPPTVFKDAVYQVTGVPPDRMKVMIKGGMLKDDTDWKKVNLKEGQTFMVIGAAGELPKPPEMPIVFLEDMDDVTLAEALSLPIGLKNLGNTCYMNATLQAMRAIPELQTALQNNAPSGLPSALKNLYSQMSRTTDSVVPSTFLAVLRQTFPQFAEQARNSKGLGGMFAMYAQQDAEECWVQLTNALKEVPGLPGPSSEGTISKTFVDQYMTGEMRRELRCDEAPEEPPTVTFEKVLKIECNISITTNYMLQGIKEGLNQKIEKNSPSLGRNAMYTATSRLSRLPTYLTVHMVRFAWRQDIGKKAKIMRKVKFPTDFDALELVTDELREKMLPLTDRFKKIEGDRSERRTIRKRTAARRQALATAQTAATASASEPAEVPGQVAEEVPMDLDEEPVYREREREELEALIHPDLKADVGCSVSGQYELIAIVTHKGAAADSGHYMGFAKKSAIRPIANSTAPGSSATPTVAEDDEDWYKFDDDKVSIFPKDKLATLDGGGEDSSAYVLLYKTKPLA